MKIGELSAKTGCPITRIRFYEQKGVMLEPKRGLGGQREYEKDDVTRLEFIMACRVNGMKLECIKRFLEYLDKHYACKYLLREHKVYHDDRILDNNHFFS